MVGINFRQFVDDCRMIRRQTAELGQSFCRCLILVLFDEESWSLWEEEQANTDDQSPQELNSDRNAVAATVVTVLGGVVDNGGEEESLSVSVFSPSSSTWIVLLL